ncbi:Hypothetical protein LUCI_1951 [Lucifera butyrica]|uniref:Uncharacterized protein n=1 Tax=Lucifera butyrica TaxID=1351585 RepID=A0A498R6M1_9FIRM|nr:HAD family hydrolase [Lucifera butyrica]VBB06715.1 Hypothetical protein LUCI_1951 [Lucifera butyrica]
MTAKCKGIVFDFNGVLLFDSHLNERAWRQFAISVCGRDLTAEEILVHMHGRSNKSFIEYLLQREVSLAECNEYSEQKETMYRAMCLDEGAGFCLSPGAQQLLDILAAKKIPMTIGTSAGKNNLLFYFKHLNLGNWFTMDEIVYDDGTLPCKPEPDVYIKAARKLRLRPEQCIVVEDSLSGIQAAAKAQIGKIIRIGNRMDDVKFAEGGLQFETITTLAELDSATHFAV